MGESWFSVLREPQRLIWLIGIVFAMVFTIQHFELPSDGILSSVLSSGEAPPASGGGFSHGNSSSDLKFSEDLTFSNASESNNSTIRHEVANMTTFFDGKDEDGKSTDVGKAESSGDIIGGVTDPEDELISNDTTGHDPMVEGGSDSSLESKSLISASMSFEVSSPAASPTSSQNMDTVSGNSVTPIDLNSSSVNDAAHVLPHSVVSKSNAVPSIKNSSVGIFPIVKNKSKPPPSRVVAISVMNDMLLQSQASYRAMKPRWSSALDQDLLRAKSLIKNAPAIEDELGLYATLFRNVSMFKRSYELMEKTLKVYIYPEGEKPIFHHAVIKGIYASEGWFMKLLKANKTFVTKTPTKAHLFYLPFSSRMLEEVLYVPNSHSRENLIQHLSNYLNIIRSKYQFWNRTGGADHFLVACHDWAAAETKRIMANCIRALCNADPVDEGFQFGKDVSLPETFVRTAKDPLKERGGKPPSQRHILAFFAGSMHGYVRPVLLEYWRNKDSDIKIFGQLPKGQMDYIHYMKSSRYCICAKGYEVNSPRVVEAIFYECVPVIISDNFVPPFFETLNWESFAVFILEKDIPYLKDILQSIPEKRYIEMQRRVKQVQRHFLWHTKPVKYDIFHMILHSIWYTRIFQIRPS